MLFYKKLYLNKLTHYDSNYSRFLIERLHRLSNPKNIFEKIWNHPNYSTPISANIVGTRWLDFSNFMSWFLCRAAANVGTNHNRRYLSQVAFEELGMGLSEGAHVDKFLQCLRIAKVKLTDQIEAPVEILRTALVKSENNDDYILGMYFGLEIIAIENIETLFRSLAYNITLKDELEHTDYFKTHRIHPFKHIEHCLNHLSHFSPTAETRIKFLEGFHESIRFWKEFWDECEQEISILTQSCA